MSYGSGSGAASGAASGAGSTVDRFADPDDFVSSLRATGSEYLVTRSGRFDATIIRIDLNDIWMQQLEETLPRLWHVEAADERAVIAFPAVAGAPMHFGEIEFRDGDVLLASRSMDVWHRTSGPGMLASMSIPLQRVLAADESAFCRLEAVRIVRFANGAVARFRRLHAAAVSLARSAPEIIAAASAARGLEEALADAFLACLSEPDMQTDRQYGKRHVRIVRHFLELMDERQAEPLYVSDACATLGVSQRTLHQSCQRELGVGPKQYLLLRRMHLARRALKEERARQGTVTEVATRFGFWELGRFAVAYRRLFGESPSETLRSPPGAVAA